MPPESLRNMRKHMLKILLREEKRSRPFVDKKDRGLRVCISSPEGRQTNWRFAEENEAYDYRTILRSEIVLDIGDDGDWEKCRQNTHAAWNLLNTMEVPYWGALTGGKGTHTHIFLEQFIGESLEHRPRPYWDGEYKRPIDYSIPYENERGDLHFLWDAPRAPFNIKYRDLRIDFVREMAHILGEDGLGADPRLTSPHWRSHLVREFGARKKPGDPWRKTLWTTGPGPYKLLSASRNLAYADDALRVPREIVLFRNSVSFSKEIRDAVGGQCPKGQACLADIPCDHCPATC